MRETVLEAVLRSADAPSEVQRNRFAAFLKKQYGQEVPLRWEQDPALEKGFRMEVGADLYDWSLEGRLRQFRERLEQLNPAGVSVIPLMREAVRNWQPDAAPEEVGSVLTVGDEIATVSGLEHAAYGEILQFSSGVKGMVQDLRPDRVGCILFGGSEAIESGSIVRRTGKTAGIPVGDGFLGRVVDALGMPIDGQGDIPSEGYLPIESPAPGIIDRQPVNAPMETGLLAIDSMFPIGRGQRELIIGDRQTGKTAKDISKKRRIVNKMKGNAGVPLSPPPYGYIKNPDDPRFWVVEPEAAEVVRRIYRMALEGYGLAETAAQLAGDAAGAVHQQVGEPGREDPGFFPALVEVGVPVHSILFNIPEHLVGDLAQTGLRISVGRRGVAIHGTEVAVAIHQHIAHGEVLCQTHQRVIHGGIAVGMIPAQHVAHAGSRLLKGLVACQIVLVHGVQNAPVHRLQAVPHIRQGAAHNDAHGIFDIGLFHLRHQRRFHDSLFRIPDLLGVILGFFTHFFSSLRDQ